MRIFITGATGFIGKHLLNKLEKQGMTLLVLSRQNMRENDGASRSFIQGNLENILNLKEQIASFSPDAVIHMAWEGIPDYLYYMSEKNLLYGLNILEICRFAGCKKLIITGSCWEYKKPLGLVKEDWPVCSDNSFKAAKNSLRMMSEAFCSEHGIAFNWLRLFYVYGPGQKAASLIPSIIRSIQKGEQPKLLTPHNKLDYIYVKDVVSCIAYVLENKMESGVFNVGSGIMTENIEILKIIAERMNLEIREADYVQDSGSRLSFGANTEKLNALGFNATYSLAESVGEILDTSGSY